MEPLPRRCDTGYVARTYVRSRDDESHNGFWIGGSPMANVKPIPEGYPRVTPYLCVDGALAAIGFYCDVLGATERMHMPGPDGKIGHAEIQIGDGVVMLSDPFP